MPFSFLLAPARAHGEARAPSPRPGLADPPRTREHLPPSAILFDPANIPVHASRDPRSIAESGFAGPARELPHRAAMESLFRRDLGGVRSYNDAASARACRALHAHAFTVGDRIGFTDPCPPPALVAHELTHALQHGDPTRGRRACESEADAVEHAVAAGRPLPRVPHGRIARAAAHTAPACKPIAPLLGARPVEGKPIAPGSLRFSEVTGPQGRTRSIELQLQGFALPAIQISPLVSLQIVPELRVLAGERTKHDRTSDMLTVSGRVIASLTGGFILAAEVFGSLTGFAEIQIGQERAPGPDADEQETTEFGSAVVRLTGRVGVRALRRLVEKSIDTPTFSLFRIEYSNGKDPKTGQSKGWSFKLLPELFQIADVLGRSIGEALSPKLDTQLLAAGWHTLQGAAALAAATGRVATGLVPGALGNIHDRLDTSLWDPAATPTRTLIAAQTVADKLFPLAPDALARQGVLPIGAHGVTLEQARAVASEINTALDARQDGRSYSPGALLGMTAPAFIDLLVELRLLRFTRDLASFTIPTNAVAAPPAP